MTVKQKWLKKQAETLSHLSNLAVKNDLHFKKFVTENNIPKEYKKPVELMMNYFKALNSTIANVDEDIEKLSYQPQIKSMLSTCQQNMPVMLIKSNKIKLKIS